VMARSKKSAMRRSSGGRRAVAAPEPKPKRRTRNCLPGLPRRGSASPPLLSVWIRSVRASPPLLSAWIRPVHAAPRSSPVTVIVVTPELAIDLPVVTCIELLLCAHRRRSSLCAPRIGMRQLHRGERIRHDARSARASATMRFGIRALLEPLQCRYKNITSTTQCAVVLEMILANHVEPSTHIPTDRISHQLLCWNTITFII
jgi:hypothetical protein